MSEHLLLITLGPVQEFIAQARRTRDLWYGSHLLSELGRAAARSLVHHRAALIFPALKPGDGELAKCLAPLRNGHPPLNVANRLLARLPEGIDPEDVARSVRDDVMKFWREEIAEPVRRECTGRLLAEGVDPVWDEQIASFVEFAAAWAPLGEYHGTRKALERAIAGRKNLRDFRPWRHQRGAVPKSSLDGGRETVLAEPDRRDRKLAAQYRIATGAGGGHGEQLDAVGLVKRAGGDPHQFVPLVNIALAPWITLADQHAGDILRACREACKRVGLHEVHRPDLAWVRTFPYDASIFFPSRWRAVFEELDLGTLQDADEWGRRHVLPLYAHLSEPSPYVACLVADGDRMGATLDAIPDPAAHFEFSRILSGFAGRARKIVEQEHQGGLVYSGGDDVLAFLPVSEAVACADALRQEFRRLMEEACASFQLGVEPPTLSVGIGIGHVMESMGDLLELGRMAERQAKRGRSGEQERNGLALLVDKRSGGRRAWRARWDDGEGGPVARLKADRDLLQGRLSSRKVYEVERILRRLPEPSSASDPEGDRVEWARVLAREVKRVLSRVQSGEAAVDPATTGLDLTEADGYAALHGRVSRWVDRLLVARALAEAEPRLRQERGGGGS